MTTALELEMLLWFAAHEGTGAQFPGLLDAATAPACADVMARFALEGVAQVMLPEGKIIMGERGRIWLAMLLETPMPVSKWADPRGVPLPGQFKGDLDFRPGTVSTKMADRIDLDSPAAQAARAIRKEAAETAPTIAQQPDEREPSGIDPAVLERARNSLNGTKGGKFVPVPLPDDGTWASTAGHKRTGPPDDVPGNQFVQVFRRNGQVHQLYAASVNWKDRGKADDAIGFRLIDEPPNKIAVNNSPKSQGKAS